MIVTLAVLAEPRKTPRAEALIPVKEGNAWARVREALCWPLAPDALNICRFEPLLS